MQSDDQKRDNAQREPETETFRSKEKAGYGDDALHGIHKQLAREKEEPSEGFSPVPMIMMFLFGALVFYSGIYMANYSGEFRSDIFNPDYKPGGGDIVKIVFDPIKKGKRLFNNNCAACHQATGLGIPGAFPPLVGSPWVIGNEDRFAKILLRGLQGPVDVMGETYSGNMPSYGDNGLGWSDRDISAVGTYVRQAFENDAPPITEETVTRVRSEIADRSGAWSSADLLSAHPME